MKLRQAAGLRLTAKGPTLPEFDYYASTHYGRTPRLWWIDFEDETPTDGPFDTREEAEEHAREFHGLELAP